MNYFVAKCKVFEITKKIESMLWYAVRRDSEKLNNFSHLQLNQQSNYATNYKIELGVHFKFSGKIFHRSKSTIGGTSCFYHCQKEFLQKSHCLEEIRGQ